MFYASLDDFLKTAQAELSKGPLAVIFVEDLVAVEETIRHHLNLGFRTALVFAPDELTLTVELDPLIHRIRYRARQRGVLTQAINALIAATPPKTWMYYCFNAEFLFFPFAGSRRVGEMLAFHTEERRPAMLTYVIDLYPADLNAAPNGVDLEHAMFDRTGYYALNRAGPDGKAKERQVDCFGGVRWRFEEHVPAERRRIDRISLFQPAPNLKLRADHTFNIEEYNTYACPWHHNLTAAVASFRAAKALMANPDSRKEINSFTWQNSAPFSWRSQQLMDLGLMEPGQWF